MVMGVNFDAVTTNPLCDEVNPALGAPLAALPLLEVNCPSHLSHHTVQPVGGGMNTDLRLNIVVHFWKPLIPLKESG